MLQGAVLLATFQYNQHRYVPTFGVAIRGRRGVSPYRQKQAHPELLTGVWSEPASAASHDGCWILRHHVTVESLCHGHVVWHVFCLKGD
mmetsp:Transcript_16562/g.22281  ORF Transcript_16562/g.22281 Transcript_16562/m.22281 type:complete len:89 (+) Transcript_16562:678-944(+)